MINFLKNVSTAKYHDPTRNFEVNEVNCEKRYDPLTGKLVRIFPFRKLVFPRHDWEPFVEESRQRFCPFCPGVIEKATPRFTGDLIPEGRIQSGEALLVPNLHPYEAHTGVVVMTPRHYLSMQDISHAVITDSIRAGLKYLKVLKEKDPDNARYCSINWNYMPYAGGSLIHPHLQVIAGPDPCNLDSEMLKSAAEYFRNNGTYFWRDLVSAEREGDRYLGSTGDIQWLATFAPLALGDVTAVLQDCATVDDLSESLIAELADGFKRVISYYDSVNIPAFNMALYFAGKEDAGFCCTARLVGRYTLFPLVGSDVSHMQMLHHDPWTLHLPEEMARDLRQFFK